MKFKDIVFEIVIIILISAAIGITYELMVPDKTYKQSAGAFNPSVVDPDYAPPSVFEVMEIDYETMKLVTQSPDVVIIDARNEEEYNDGHIEGALHIYPLVDNEILIEQLIPLPTDKNIFLYCNNPECDLAEELIRIMMAEMELQHLYYYKGGWDEWAAKQKEE